MNQLDRVINRIYGIDPGRDIRTTADKSAYEKLHTIMKIAFLIGLTAILGVILSWGWWK